VGAVTSLVFGASVVVNKAGLDRSGLAPVDYTVMSALVAGALSVPPLSMRARLVRSCSATCLSKICFIGVFASGVAYLLLFRGQSLTSATNAGFIMTLTAFFTVVSAAILIGERIERHKYPMMGLLFAGLYLLTVGTNSLRLNPGDLLIAGTALIWGVTNSAARSVMSELPGLPVAWLRLLTGAVFLALVLRVSPAEAATAARGDFWFLASGSLMWASIVLFYKTIEILGAGTASLVVVSSPVFATAGAVLFLGEALTREDLAGGAIILLSLAGITYRAAPPPVVGRPHAPPRTAPRGGLSRTSRGATRRRQK